MARLCERAANLAYVGEGDSARMCSLLVREGVNSVMAVAKD